MSSIGVGFVWAMFRVNFSAVEDGVTCSAGRVKGRVEGRVEGFSIDPQ